MKLSIPRGCTRPLLVALLAPGVSLLTAFSLPFAVHPPPEDAPAIASASLKTAAVIKQGRTMFVRSCAHCHGSDAHGSGEDADGPDLYDLPISDARIVAVVRTGISGEMPAFGKKYSPGDVHLIIAYLRTLR